MELVLLEELERPRGPGPWDLRVELQKFSVKRREIKGNLPLFSPSSFFLASPLFRLKGHNYERSRLDFHFARGFTIHSHSKHLGS